LVGTARFQFGEFEFDSETDVLTHKGRPVGLQAQPSTLLKLLLMRNNQVVSREELKNAIWRDGTYVDFEKGLNFCVAQVRAALQDDASRPLYVRTIPKRGYQFVAPVRVVNHNADLAQIAPAAEAPRVRWIPLAFAALGLISLALLAGIALSRANARQLPNIAVVHFDAETDTAAARAATDILTDDVVVRLTAAGDGHYRVIGNASILRQPRAQRDLNAIGSSLHCDYAVLGQVYSEGGKVLVLAHLIRLSDLTHIWVVRIERNLDSRLPFESDVAEQIAAQFSDKMMHRPERAASFPVANR